MGSTMEDSITRLRRELETLTEECNKLKHDKQHLKNRLIRMTWERDLVLNRLDSLSGKVFGRSQEVLGSVSNQKRSGCEDQDAPGDNSRHDATTRAPSSDYSPPPSASPTPPSPSFVHSWPQYDVPTPPASRRSSSTPPRVALWAPIHSTESAVDSDSEDDDDAQDDLPSPARITQNTDSVASPLVGDSIQASTTAVFCPGKLLPSTSFTFNFKRQRIAPGNLISPSFSETSLVKENYPASDALFVRLSPRKSDYQRDFPCVSTATSSQHHDVLLQWDPACKEGLAEDQWRECDMESNSDTAVDSPPPQQPESRSWYDSMSCRCI